MEHTTLAMVLQLGFALICVMGAIFGLAWLTKKLNLGSIGQQKHMRVVGVLPLSAREKAILIDVAGKQFLLGVAPGRVNTLADLSEAALVDQVNTDAKSKSEDSQDQDLHFGAKTVSEFSKKLQACLSARNTHEQ